MAQPDAALLSIGDELLSGRTVNSNAAWLAGELRRNGVRVVEAIVVPDEEEAIVAALASLTARAGVVLVTGGLGPTPDDLTREALSAFAGVPLRADETLAREIAARTSGRAPEQNARMARLPAGSEPLPNPTGSAPGFTMESGGCRLYVLPGVPSEMRGMFTDAVLPDLRARHPLRPLPTRILRCFGLREAELAAALGDLLARGSQPVMGLTARDAVLTVTIQGPGADARAAAVRDCMGSHFLGEGDVVPARAAFQALDEAGLSVACAESLTGGLLASELAGLAGASRVLLGGVVAYDPEAKTRLLGVSAEDLERHGAVSEAVAGAMAGGVRRRLEADVGVATTGAAGPDPDPGGASPGTVFVAVAAADRIRVRELSIPGPRNAVRRRAANAAWDLVRRVVRGRA